MLCVCCVCVACVLCVCCVCVVCVLCAGFVQFVQKEVTDGHLQQVDVCTRRVTNLLGPWKAVAQSTQNNKVSLSVCGSV